MSKWNSNRSKSERIVKLWRSILNDQDETASRAFNAFSWHDFQEFHSDLSVTDVLSTAASHYDPPLVQYLERS